MWQTEELNYITITTDTEKSFDINYHSFINEKRMLVITSSIQHFREVLARIIMQEKEKRKK